ncbi:MAG: hypothetical protein E6J87_06685 [Deltaproteobacteria bacterium]|nr:MAG: hypothetical protein E6J87_06685 [Deltaproteobacteria bacterium]
MPRANSDPWPAIPLAEWEDTLATLHLWSQVIGKVKLRRAPIANHWWGSTLLLTSRGFTTGPIPCGGRTFDAELDFIDQRAVFSASDGSRRAVELRPRSVADFYRAACAALDALGLATPIRTLPSEIEGAIPLDEDETHRAYDGDAAQRFWRATLSAHRVLGEFRARFVGKCSPVHFFWGGFDLAVTRFSGRRAPAPTRALPGYPRWANAEAYSHECSSAGFWPGQGLGHAAFYSYAYPEPSGFAAARVLPDAAAYSDDFGQFLFPYGAVRTAADPDAALLAFLQSTYEAAADCGGWKREELERAPEELARLERNLGRQD